MKTNSLSPVLLMPILAMFSIAGHAQDLNLFQDSGGNNQRGQFGPGGTPPGAAAAEAPSAPALLLKGIYRFGDVYHVSLQSGDGEAVYTATWQQGQNGGAAAVVNGYQLQSVDNKTVTLGMPAGVSCQQNVVGGSNCLSRNQMALTLAESAPTSTTRRGRGGPPRGNNNNDLPAFLQNATNGGNVDIRALFDAAQNGDPNAAQAARDAIRQQFGNRGGRGGRGGFNGGNDNGGGNNGRFNGGNNNTGGRGGGGTIITTGGGAGGGNNNTGGRGGGFPNGGGGFGQ